jgi:hypothetical protein
MGMTVEQYYNFLYEQQQRLAQHGPDVAVPEDEDDEMLMYVRGASPPRGPRPDAAGPDDYPPIGVGGPPSSSFRRRGGYYEDDVRVIGPAGHDEEMIGGPGGRGVGPRYGGVDRSGRRRRSDDGETYGDEEAYGEEDGQEEESDYMAELRQVAEEVKNPRKRVLDNEG